MKSLKLTGIVALALVLLVPTTMLISQRVAAKEQSEELTEVWYFPAWWWHWEDAAVPVGIEEGVFEKHGIKIMNPERGAGGPGKPVIRRMLTAPGISFCTHYSWYALKGRVDRGWPVKVIATSFQDPALRLVSWSPIEQKSDLYGKKAEVWPTYEYPLETYLGEKHLVHKQAPTEKKAKVSRGQQTVNRFTTHQMDASHAMIYNELLQLQEIYGIDQIVPGKNKYKTNNGENLYVYKYSELNPKLAWDENSIITKTETLKKHPGVVDRFLEAYYESWKLVMQMNPEKVMEILTMRKYNERLKDYWSREKRGGKKVNDLLVNKNTCEYGLGYVDPTTWPEMADILYKAGKLENKPTEAQLWSTYEYRPIGVFPPKDLCSQK